MIKNISNLGDAALYCDFGNSINKELNTNVIRYFKDLKSKLGLLCDGIIIEYLNMI